MDEDSNYSTVMFKNRPAAQTGESLLLPLNQAAIKDVSLFVELQSLEISLYLH